MTVALSELQLRVREMADMGTSAQASAFITDAELARSINRHLRSLYNKLIIARGDDYYVVQVAFTVAAGVQFVPVPPDFFQLTTLTASIGGVVADVPKFGPKDIAALLTSGASVAAWRCFYRLCAAGLELLPVPSVALEMVLYYVPRCPELVLPGDTFDGFNGWEDWACYGAAIDALNKEESFEQSGALAAARGVLDQQIQALAGNRDAGRPESVQDTRRDWAHVRAYGRSNWGA